MVLDRNRPPFAYSKRVKVHRAKLLSDQLAGLPKDELRLLRRFIKDPQEPGIQQILAKPVLSEYTIQELRVALAILSGVGGISLSETPPKEETVQIRDMLRETKPLAVPEISLIDNQNRLIPSRLSPEIAHKLQTMPEDAFQWLAYHIHNPVDPRSRFIMIRYHLYRYRLEDLASTIATLLRLKRRRQRSITKTTRRRLSLSSPKFH